jgi:hypothetical protein
MKKLILCLFLFSTTCCAQGVSHTNVALYNSGGNARIVPSALITVCNASDPQVPCTTKVSLYTDPGLSVPLANPFNADANGNYTFYVAAGNYTVTVTGAGVIGYSYQISLLGGAGVGTANIWTQPQTFSAAMNANNGGALNGTFTGPTTLSGNLTTTGQDNISAFNINNILYVDGNKYANLAAALAVVPANGAIVVDTLVEAFTVNPFAGVTNPVWVQLGRGIWTTTVPVVLGANQWLTGAGPQQTQIKAVAGFASVTQGVVTLGSGPEIHSSYVRDMGLACNGVAACTGLVFDGTQNPSGASNIVVSNFTADGIRIQQTTQPSGAIALRDIWTYALQGAAASGDDLNIHQFAGNVLVENFIGAQDHSFPGPATFNVAGGSGMVVFIGCGGEGITDQYLLAASGVTVTIIGANQVASTPPAGTNTIHVTAAFGGQYTLINANQGTSTNAMLVDDIRTTTLHGGISFYTAAGGTSFYTFGSSPELQWIRSPLSTTQVVDQIRLPTSFVGSQTTYQVRHSDGVTTQFSVTNDGRISFRGNQTGAFQSILQSDTLTASRTVQHPNGISATVMVASLVTTAATTDAVAVQGMTASGHCSLTATNAAAAAATTPSVTTKGANTITVTHAVTANMNYDIMCTSN